MLNILKIKYLPDDDEKWYSPMDRTLRRELKKIFQIIGLIHQNLKI